MPKNLYKSLRPDLAQRRFSSPAIEACIADVSGRIADKEVAWLFSNCFPNTLDTTVIADEINGIPDTLVITGDIPAMWLRDSTAQVWPYLPLAKADEGLRSLIAGVLNRQVSCVLLDPYANAFELDPTLPSIWEDDITAMKPGIHERKYELDSLCAAMRLSRGYYNATGDSSCFGPRWKTAMALILETIRREQEPVAEGEAPVYRFERIAARGVDTLPINGSTYPAKRCGLSRCGFRPSDDAVVLPYLIPANAMAVVELLHLSRILKDVVGDLTLAETAGALAQEIDAGIRKRGIVNHPDCGEIYAYEVDGFGSWYFMDDANVPSLLSLPYLGYCDVSDPIYQNTRKALLSKFNPFYSEGVAGAGIGGPHVGPGNIWPMSIIMQIFTSTDADEIRKCLKMLKGTHGGTGWMHETFWKDDPTTFTRAWFAWANTLFGEMILHLDREWPELLKEQF